MVLVGARTSFATLGKELEKRKKEKVESEMETCNSLVDAAGRSFEEAACRLPHRLAATRECNSPQSPLVARGGSIVLWMLRIRVLDLICGDGLR